MNALLAIAAALLMMTASDPQPYIDTEASVHGDAIESLAEWGITRGCDAVGVRYCPSANITRAQMASFLSRAFVAPSSSEDYFSDDTGNTHEANINSIASVSITRGCAPGRFCPDAAVSRGQMAAFLTRTLDLPPGKDAFSDDERSVFESAINAMAAAGITSGCDSGAFCPEAQVTRGQIATLLVRALEWLGCGSA